MSNVDTNGKRLNLFPMKKKKVSSNQAFDMMESVADKSSVNLLKIGEIDKSTKGIHTALMAAGMTPAYGNVADLVDATLYALEGEFGEAAWAAASAIPVIGQMVAGKRALKIAKESGEGTVKLYRGVQTWERGKQVKKGNWVSPDKYEFAGEAAINQPTKRGIWATEYFDEAADYAKYSDEMAEDAGKMGGEVLEFEVPKSWYDKKVKESYERTGGFQDWIDEGIPKEYLTKVHKAKEYVDPYVRGKDFSPY